MGDHTLYTVNEVDSINSHGTGILIKKSLNPKFTRLTGRICVAEIEMNDTKLFFISAYSHTSEKSEKNPELREEFYDTLEGFISTIPSRQEVILAGDFNAKTGSAYEDFCTVMGKFGKGEANNSGIRLLETCQKLDLYLTNTTFNHKMSHRTTWTAPYREFTTHLGEKRRNPVRNQIDYIITRSRSKRFVKNSRSYGGTETESDHKLVKMTMDINWKRIRSKNIKVERLDTEGFSDIKTKKEYQKEVKIATTNIKANNAQERWNQICKVVRETGKKVLGSKKITKRANDKHLETLSEKKFKIRMDINSTTEITTRKEKQQELKEIKKEAKARLKEVETQRINDKLIKIEEMKNDSARYFAAMKEAHSEKKQENLLVEDKDKKITTTEEEQVKIVSEYFKKMLAPEERKNDILEIPPHKMINPFTAEEIASVAKKLKNGKSPGPDNVELELIKYAPIELHNEIANIFNRVAETGEPVTELILGLLRPIPKPGKAKGPPENLRPIILLSVLRKILTICMIDRTWERLKQHIPPDQAAYQPGRGTTEQVFAIKILAEKAIISQDYSIHLLLLDMSKAFDTVNRKLLFEELQEILNGDEMYLLSVLTNRPKIQVKIGNTIGDAFETLVGIMQGDVLSAILFILYLSKSLKLPIKTKMKGFISTPKYADDITYAGTSKTQIDELEKKLPERLESYNLTVNKTKTERYTIPKPPPPPAPIPSMKTLLKHKNDKTLWSELDWLTYKPKVKNKTPDWRDCKLLGSKLDTEKDINRRKGITIDSMQKYKQTYKSRHLSIKTKVRTFNVFAASIFLYNSELWTITIKTANGIDSFHRRMLRQAINIRWPKKISSQKLYEITKVEAWSKTIKRRRLKWLGHLMRLPEETPARISLHEALRETKRKKGKPKTTWLKLIESDLKGHVKLDIYKEEAEKTLLKLTEVTRDRNTWDEIIKNIMACKS